MREVLDGEALKAWHTLNNARAYLTFEIDRLPGIRGSFFSQWTAYQEAKRILMDAAARLQEE